MQSRDDQAIALRQEYLSAMRNLASTVTIVTKANPDGPIGMTATAVCSLSADPPAIIICVNNAASLRPALHLGERFAVNLLAKGQADLATCFGGGAARAERFGFGDWNHDGECAPFLENAMGALFCTVADIHEYGSHVIIVGRVDRIRRTEDLSPLLYANGKFVSLSAT